MKISSKIVRGGQDVKNPLEFPTPNLVLNSAILLKSVEDGWNMFTNEKVENVAYQRYSNPTVLTLEKKFKCIEGSKYSLAVNSGMTACYLVFRALLSSGDHIITQHSLYHEISDQIKIDKKSSSVKCAFLAAYGIGTFARSAEAGQKMIFVESP